MTSQFQSLKLSLINIGMSILDSSWNFDDVISPFSRLLLITKGEAKVFFMNKKVVLRPGNMYLVPSYTYSSYKCDKSHEQYYVTFFERLGKGLSIYNMANFKNEAKATEMDHVYFERLLELNPNRDLKNNDPEYYDNFPLLTAYEKQNESMSADKLMETQGIMKVLLSRFILGKSNLKNSSKIRLNGVLNHISENLHESLEVGKLADFCHLSTDHFSRSFKKQFGIRPNKYIQIKRIERAQSLLLTTHNSIRDIAETVGFENVPYFSKTFKEITKITPRQFRKEQTL